MFNIAPITSEVLRFVSSHRVLNEFQSSSLLRRLVQAVRILYDESLFRKPLEFQGQSTCRDPIERPLQIAEPLGSAIELVEHKHGPSV